MSYLVHHWSASLFLVVALVAAAGSAQTLRVLP